MYEMDCFDDATRMQRVRKGRTPESWKEHSANVGRQFGGYLWTPWTFRRWIPSQFTELVEILKDFISTEEEFRNLISLADNTHNTKFAEECWDLNSLSNDGKEQFIANSAKRYYDCICGIKATNLGKLLLVSGDRLKQATFKLSDMIAKTAIGTVSLKLTDTTKKFVLSYVQDFMAGNTPFVCFSGATAKSGCKPSVGFSLIKAAAFTTCEYSFKGFTDFLKLCGVSETDLHTHHVNVLWERVKHARQLKLYTSIEDVYRADWEEGWSEDCGLLHLGKKRIVVTATNAYLVHFMTRAEISATYERVERECMDPELVSEYTQFAPLKHQEVGNSSLLQFIKAGIYYSAKAGLLNNDNTEFNLVKDIYSWDIGAVWLYFVKHLF